MAVDNAHVHRILQKFLDRARGTGILDRITDARQGLITVREAGLVAWNDLDIAAADHYLEARWMINLLSPAARNTVVAGILMYDSGKLANLTPAVGSQPVSPPSPLVTAWAFAGVTDGERDWVLRLSVRGRPRLLAPTDPYRPMVLGITSLYPFST